MMPKRIQRKRTKGWKAPDGAINCTRPGKYGNPFRIGGYFKIGNGGPGLVWLEATPQYADSSFTFIATPQQAVEMFREMRRLYPKDLSELRGKDLMCWCGLDKPCHVDVLLEIANAPEVLP